MKSRNIEITEDQAAQFEAMGYEVVRQLYAIVPECPKNGRKPGRAETMSQYAVLRFHELPQDKLPPGAEGEFYQKLWEEFQSVDMADMRRNCLTKQMAARFPQHSVGSVRASISKMVHEYRALSVVAQRDTGEA